jgi:hypothetical protein
VIRRGDVEHRRSELWPGNVGRCGPLIWIIVAAVGDQQVMIVVGVRAGKRSSACLNRPVVLQGSRTVITFCQRTSPHSREFPRSSHSETVHVGKNDITWITVCSPSGQVFMASSRDG